MLKTFKKVYIELSDYCGLRCHFCPQSLRKSQRGAMDLAIFERICAQLVGRSQRISLHILGDPLALKNIESYIEVVKHYRLKVDLVTTGLFLREKHFEMLLNAPFVQVAFSLSAFLANPQLLHLGHLERILGLCDENLKCNCPIFINLRIQTYDIKCHLPDLSEILESIATHFKQPLPKSLTQRVKLARKTFLNPMRSFDWTNRHSTSHFAESNTSHICYGASKQIGILSDGRLVPCCIDYEGKASFGSLVEQNLEEILQQQKFKDFFHQLLKGIPPCKLCRECAYPQNHRINIK